jgi:serine/threonine protein kinase
VKCGNCFYDTENLICPACKFDNSIGNGLLALPLGAVLAGQYVIGRVLDSPGEFGTTYVGLDIRLQKKVAIKEFWPQGYAGRDNNKQSIEGEPFKAAREQFLQEARTLANISHDSIVSIKSSFVENNIAYWVMEYYDGISLTEYVSQKGGRISQQEALAIMMPVLDGLREVHRQGLLHCNIKPQHIYLIENKRPVLLGFGAARQALTNLNKGWSALLADGFSPYEQYYGKGRQGPWTDIYACAATLYYLVTGQVPQDAVGRITSGKLILPSQLNDTLSLNFEAAILRGMAVEAVYRPQTVEEFQSHLGGNALAGYKINPASLPVLPRQASSDKAGRYITLSIVGTLLAIGLLACGVILLNSLKYQEPPVTPSTEVFRMTGELGAAPEVAQPNLVLSVPKPNYDVEVKRAVSNFYRNVSCRQYRMAYDALSEKWKARISYDDWVSDYNNIVSNQIMRLNVSYASENSATASFHLRKMRRGDNGRLITEVYDSECYLIKEQGCWVLDDILEKEADLPKGQ